MVSRIAFKTISSAWMNLSESFFPFLRRKTDQLDFMILQNRKKEQMYGWVDEWVYGWVGVWVDGWVDVWVDGWMDEYFGQEEGVSACDSKAAVLMCSQPNFRHINLIG